ncbi:hypothetical protein TcasGA2_TC007509 [Tribolium castaneum]|uniref:Uncharacterized protein n=1 Tax=Tribolium castaneum TaxID=7070 RepID=D2A3J3_TRICA|nr:hypothetical protein TcasGA2_TC007509 [Tribolium castaneum]
MAVALRRFDDIDSRRDAYVASVSVRALKNLNITALQATTEGQTASPMPMLSPFHDGETRKMGAFPEPGLRDRDAPARDVTTSLDLFPC